MRDEEIVERRGTLRLPSAPMRPSSEGPGLVGEPRSGNASWGILARLGRSLWRDPPGDRRRGQARTIRGPMGRWPPGSPGDRRHVVIGGLAGHRAGLARGLAHAASTRRRPALRRSSSSMRATSTSSRRGRAGERRSCRRRSTARRSPGGETSATSSASVSGRRPATAEWFAQSVVSPSARRCRRSTRTSASAQTAHASVATCPRRALW